MKKHLLPLTLSMLALAGIMLIESCNEDEKPRLIPEVTTAAVTDVTTTTATSGGEIVSDGNALITANGVAYSSANNMPTIADSKTEQTTTSGTFTSELIGLTSGTQYYVRAYATNEVGTGYGEVVTFTTGNAAPSATNITITGTAQVLETLKVTYSYSDAENDSESGTIVQWYVANDGAGAGETAIVGATESTYTLQSADEFKYIRVGITTKAATGAANGAEVRSSFVGPVAEEPATITFAYNGVQVTYGIVISPVTGRRWLDRNLGAPNTPTSHTDFANSGDLFQWGRLADGHQVVTRGATSATTSGSATTTTLSTTDAPGHALFILRGPSPFDWRSPSNDDLWQGVSSINNPCPVGWRIPTTVEWEAENLSLIANAYTQLKLTFTGFRQASAGAAIGSVTAVGSYWTTTKRTSDPGTIDVFDFRINPTTNLNWDYRAGGRSCRCIKN